MRSYGTLLRTEFGSLIHIRCSINSYHNKNSNNGLLLPVTLKGLRFDTICKLNKLACYSLMDLGRRHNTPGSEGKNFITPSSSSSHSISIACSLSPSSQGGPLRRPGDTSKCSELHSVREKL